MIWGARLHQNPTSLDPNSKTYIHIWTTLMFFEPSVIRWCHKSPENMDSLIWGGWGNWLRDHEWWIVMGLLPFLNDNKLLLRFNLSLVQVSVDREGEIERGRTSTTCYYCLKMGSEWMIYKLSAWIVRNKTGEKGHRYHKGLAPWINSGETSCVGIRHWLSHLDLVASSQPLKHCEKSKSYSWDVVTRLPWGFTMACCRVLSGVEGLSAFLCIWGMWDFLVNGMPDVLIMITVKKERKKLNPRKVCNSR